MATSIVAVGTVPLMAAAMHEEQCPSSAFTLRANRNEGAFAGMSHDGAELDLRNVSSTACALPTLPALSFVTPRVRRCQSRRTAALPQIM